jgi:hypothetical protein
MLVCNKATLALFIFCEIQPSSAPTPLGLEPVETDGFTSLMISRFYSGRDDIRTSEDMAHRFNAHGQPAECGQKTPNRRLVILRWDMDDEGPCESFGLFFFDATIFCAAASNVTMRSLQR